MVEVKAGCEVGGGSWVCGWEEAGWVGEVSGACILFLVCWDIGGEHGRGRWSLSSRRSESSK